MIGSIKEDVTKTKGPGDGTRGQMRTTMIVECFTSSCKGDFWRPTIP